MPELIPLAAAHVSVAAALHALCFEHPWDESAIGGLLALPGVFGWVAVTETLEPVGFILCRVAATESEVLAVCVVPARRRGGVGRALIEAACVRAARGHATEMFLEVADTNEHALRLYDRAGFVRFGLRRGYYRSPAGTVDAVLLRRDLPKY